MKSNVLEVEFDTVTNANVLFQPLGRTLRGRFDVRRMRNAGRLFTAWPDPIPGQRVAVDMQSGEVEVVEPLWQPEFTTTRERIERRGMKLAQGRENVQAHLPTVLYWLTQLVETGKAKIVQGALPGKIEGTPKTRFHSTEQPDPLTQLTAAITEQNQLMAKLLSKLADAKLH